jgi:hypothetical protein
MQLKDFFHYQSDLPHNQPLINYSTHNDEDEQPIIERLNNGKILVVNF